jgi:hypothetical protein
MKTLIFLITIIAATSLMRAGEIVPVWDQEWDINPDGHARLLDIDFLKGEDQFIMIGVDGEIGTIEVRETLTGEQVRSIQVDNLIEGNEIEVTQDSTRFLMSTGFLGENNAALELRNIDDLSLIRKYEVPLEGDSLGELGSYYRNRILSMRIDPVKPYVYFILEKKLIRGQFGKNDDYYAIKVYNYETMEEVRELRTYKNDYMKSLDVSHDGKYLAYVDEGEAYINIWDLNNFEFISSYRVSKNYKDIQWETDISAFQFSKLNSQIIYFSGLISNKNEPNKPDNGVFEYSIERGNHINRLPENGYSGRLIFAEDEKILFLNFGSPMLFFNMLTDTLEFSVGFPTGGDIEIKAQSSDSSTYNVKFLIRSI